MSFKVTNQHLRMALIASLSLGLAPFNPPHVIGKIKWVMGGGIGMKPIDYFDLLLHGSPWVILIILVILRIVKK